MSAIGDAIQEKCLAFGDRVIKLNDFLLKEAANAKSSFKMVNGNLLFGHNRKGVWKGMLEMPLYEDNTFDQMAMAYLNSL